MHAMAGAGRLRGLAILGAVAAGLLVLVATFATLCTAVLPTARNQAELTFELTNWGVESNWDDEIATDLFVAPDTGYPLVFCAVVLFAAGVVSGAARSTPGARAAGLLTAVGAALLVGVAWSVGMVVLPFGDAFDLQRDGAPVAELSAGSGLWLLGAAVVLAVGAAVAAFLRGREEHVPPEADLATPALGFPVPVQLPNQDPPPSAPAPPDIPPPDIPPPDIPEQPYVRHAADVPPPPTGLAPLAGPAPTDPERRRDDPVDG